MTSTEPVEVVVEIIDSFSDELAELKGELKEIDLTQINIDVDADDDGDIESIKAQLEALQKKIDTDVDVDTEGVEKAQAEKLALSKDMRSVLHIDTDAESAMLDRAAANDFLSNIDEATDTGDLKTNPFETLFGDTELSQKATMDFEGGTGLIDALEESGNFHNNLDDATSSAKRLKAEIDSEKLSPDDASRKLKAAQKAAEGTKEAVDDIGQPDFDLSGGPGGIGPADVAEPPEVDTKINTDPLNAEFGGDTLGRSFSIESPLDAKSVREQGLKAKQAARKVSSSKLFEWSKKSRKGISKLGGTLNRLRPNIMQVWNALATLLPVIITLGGAAIGLAGALAAVGVAAAAIVGVGMLGWGDSLSQSFSNLKREAQELKRELFEVMQPAAQEFQPIMARWMEGAPEQVKKLVGPLQELTVFADTIEAAGAGFVDWLGRVFKSMVALQAPIDRIVMSFGKAFGGFIIGLMERFIIFTDRNRAMIIELASSIAQLLGAIFDLASAFTSVLVILGPVVDIVAAAADLLNNALVVALGRAVTVILMAEAALAAYNVIAGITLAQIKATAATIVSTYIPAIWGMITSIWELNGALGVMARLLTLTGIGALVVGAGAIGAGALNLPGENDGPGARPGSSGSTGGGGVTINVDGNVGTRELDRIIDSVPDQAASEIDAQNKTSK